MNLEKFELKVLQILGILRHICFQKTFEVSELENRFEIAPSTLYRYLDIWCNCRYIQRRRNSNGYGTHNEFKITQKGLLFFAEFRKKVLNILESNIEKLIEKQVK